jgi:hypothetical protein
VEVGAQQHGPVGRRRECPKQRDAVARQARVEPSSIGQGLLFELVRPRVAHDLQRPEAVTGRGGQPEPAQQPGDDGVLLGLGSTCQAGSGHTSLEEQGGCVVELVGGMESDRTVSAPGAQAVGLVGRLRVPPCHLQHQVPTGITAGRGHPGRLTARLERLTELERPPFSQARHGHRQGCHPRSTAIPLRRLDEVPGNPKGHRGHLAARDAHGLRLGGRPVRAG